MQEYFVGVDVSKGYADFVLLDQARKRVIPSFRLDDTAQGHEALRRLLTEFCMTTSPGAILYVGVESTGGLEDNWLSLLRKMSAVLPVKSARLNPAGVAVYIKADRTRTITDAVSAVKIAEYLISHWHKIRFNEEPGILASQRPLWTTLTMLKKQRGQLTNSLHHLLYGALPTLLIYCRKGIPGWVLSVLDKYPTASHLAAARVSSLSKLPYVTAERAEKLITAAKSDVASHTEHATVTAITSIVEQVRHIDNTIKTMEKDLFDQVKNDARVKLLCTFNGIAELSAVGLLMNMPSLECIPNAQHLASFWGLHPVFKDSGDGHMAAHMSKVGRTPPRSILYMVTLSAICCNPLIKALYRRLIYRKKMCRMAAIGVCMHKIARIVYGMLKTKTPFNPAIDQANQATHTTISKESVIQKEEQRVRRFQPSDATAPISGREKKRREKINGSQYTCGVMSGISVVLPSDNKNVLVTT